MTANELRQKYLQFFQDHQHAIIDSASLIPENDPTVLFTTAGMHPLVPYLLGQKHPAGVRLTSAQKCVRTGDIDEVGDATHLTFFEMLGNWSLGDYFKQESIDYSWEFLTDSKYLGLDPARLAFSVFEGDSDSPFDQESYDQWLSKGVAQDRIAKLAKSDNWWGPAGTTGPCGPDTEIFYWIGDLPAPANFQDTHEDKNWVEIWNNVFMAYNKNADGSYSELAQKNVDTGMGLERTLCILNNLSDPYQTDLFASAIAKIEELSAKKYDDFKKEFRIIVDHLRTATFIIGDERGVTPSNTDQGYIVRRLIRRAVRFGRSIGINEALWTSQVAEIYINEYASSYPELTQHQAFIIENLTKEEVKFVETLERGLKEFHKLSGNISGSSAFDLYQSYGFPIELTQELATERGVTVDLDGFNQEFNKHQDLSRTASAGKFKGGLADHSEDTTKLHTATHLLQSALRRVLGDHVFQKGSNITVERLRFDFSHPDKMTPEQIAEVESIVNDVIKQALPVTMVEVSLEEAKRMKALGVFESKYNEMVKVYTVGGETDYYSREICGGPHVSNTSELGSFKILKEEASSAGVRRIKAVVS
jgi:alanyl-tRNA synthetase